MRRFKLLCHAESGIGIVAEGIQFSDGTAVLRWSAAVRYTIVWDTIADVEAMPGHHELVWLDARPPAMATLRAVEPQRNPL